MDLPDDSPKNVKVTWTDSKGFEAKVDGPSTWESSNPDVLVVTANDDGTAKLEAADGATPGQTAQVKATADADLGDGVEPVVALGDITIVAGKAVAGVIGPA